MKFKTDENLPVEVAEVLRQEGHDALSVIDQRLAGRPDVNLAAICQREQRVLVTLDLDFSDIRSYPPEEYSGFIVLRPPLQTIPLILELTNLAMSVFDTEPLVGHLWIVDPRRVRIREGHPPESS